MSESCACCFESVNEKLQCGHSIHIECVCLSGKLKCPICRCDIDEKIIPPELLKMYEIKKKQMNEYKNEIENEFINNAINNNDYTYDINVDNMMFYYMEDMLARMQYNIIS